MTAKKSPPARRAKRRRPTHAQPPIERLLAIMARLRDPAAGCPWDREQNFATIAPYTIEEAYEVAEAAERNAMRELKEELGDLLLQVAFHARMAEEIGEFDFDDVAAAIADKMVRRHPHVFGAARIGSAAAQTAAWEDQKAHERRAKSADQGQRISALDGVGQALPALTRAAKLQRRAARVGFDWPDVAPIYDKITEEIAELKAESGNRSRSEDELGDLLFAVVNLARRLEIDPERALRGACRKFERRFRQIEDRLAARGIDSAHAGLDALEAEWQAVKAKER
ncbi:MAG: nucleoside triphosphate pyrophosphohydrolase [Alphaproteobacteria bacterium]|nr:nucleoside triphosphate pyrophosphohydrolase [Alphaproteobacteria bacterium]